MKNKILPIITIFLLMTFFAFVESPEDMLKECGRESGGNKTMASKLIGLPNHQTFTNWMKKHKVTDQ